MHPTWSFFPLPPPLKNPDCVPKQTQIYSADILIEILYKSGPPQFQTLRCEVYVNSYIWRMNKPLNLKKKNGLATLEFGGGTSERAPSSFTRGKAGGFSFFWSHILKTVSVTHKELAGEEAEEAPRSLQRLKTVQKSVSEAFIQPHTPHKRTGGCLWPFLRKLVPRPRMV